MKKEMLINVLQPEECRIAILEDNILEELYVERTSQESYVGNIYIGRIVNIEPSIQAAFVDFGVGRNGFLHVSDVDPEYYRHLEGFSEREGRDDRGGQGGRGGRGGRGRQGGQGGQSGRSRRDGGGSRRRDAAYTLTREDIEAREGQAARPLPETELATEEESRWPAPAEDFAVEGGDFPSAPELLDELHDIDEQNAAELPAYTQEPATDDLEDMEPLPPPSDHEQALGDRPEIDQLTDDDLSFSRPTPESRTVYPSSPEQESPAPARESDELDELDDLTAANDRLPTAEVRAEQFDMPPREFDEPGDEMRGDQMRGDGMRSEFEEEEDIPPMPRSRGRSRGRDDRRGGGRRGGPRRMGGRPGFGRPKPLIQDIFKRGQKVLVQVIKEGLGTKGPTLSTYISIAGRYLVLMPGLKRIGVSRKIGDDEQRRHLRDIMHQLKPPRGLGFIIRTAGLDRTRKELQRDLAYLTRLWKVCCRRIDKLRGPGEIYQESDMITRTIRDTFTSEIDTIWVDEQAAFDHAQEFLQIVMPRYAERIKHYDAPEPMFHKYGIESEIVRIQQRHVPLLNGGSIVIDQTEALVAIDVNSGNFRADNNAEETAYRMNLLAAKEIARQLRLRDLGGVIVNDFIDMREDKHRRGVERALRDAVKRDRARTKILRISAFGIIEMTRQRIRPSLKRSVYQDCPHCHATGQVKTCESMSIDVMRLIQLAAHQDNIQRVQVRVHDDVAHYLLNRKRKEISRLEESGEIQVHIVGVPGVSPEQLDFNCYDNNNNEVKFSPYEEPRPSRRR